MCAGPDLARHRLLEDLLAHLLQLGDGSVDDEGQGGGAGTMDVFGILGADLETHLLVTETGQVASPDELARVQPSSEVEQRGATDKGVVEVEEGGSARVCWKIDACLGLGSRCRCLSGNNEPVPQAPVGPEGHAPSVVVRRLGGPGSVR